MIQTTVPQKIVALLMLPGDSVSWMEGFICIKYEKFTCQCGMCPRRFRLLMQCLVNIQYQIILKSTAVDRTLIIVSE